MVLFANSRGGYAVRNYIANGGGAAKVSHAILGGTPNHGVWADPAVRPGSEFNGAGAFLTRLNAPQGPGGAEVTPGRALADDPVGRQRQVRPARRRLDRHSRQADERRPTTARR